MDARTYISSPSAGRHLTGAALRFDAGSVSGLSRIFRNATVEIFKKTPTIPGLKPRGPDVAQDLREFDVIPLLTMTLPECRTRADDLNAKLTDKESSLHTSEWMQRATNHTSGAMWIDALQVGSAPGGVADPVRTGPREVL